MAKTNFKKIKHERDFRLEHEGKFWTVEIAEWHDETSGKSELRCYRIDGDVSRPALIQEALEHEAQGRGLSAALIAPRE